MKILYPEAHFLNYGMGWFLSDYHGRKMVEHGGSIDGMRGLVAMIPEEKIGVVILANMSGTTISVPLSYRIFDAYLGVPLRDWSAEMLEDDERFARAGQSRRMRNMEAARIKDTKPSLALENYAGDYQNEMYGDTKVVAENGKLILKRGAYFTGDLEHWHYDTFRVVVARPAGRRRLRQFPAQLAGQNRNDEYGRSGGIYASPGKETLNIGQNRLLL